MGACQAVVIGVGEDFTVARSAGHRRDVRRACSCGILLTERPHSLTITMNLLSDSAAAAFKKKAGSGEGGKNQVLSASKLRHRKNVVDSRLAIAARRERPLPSVSEAFPDGRETSVSTPGNDADAASSVRRLRSRSAATAQKQQPEKNVAHTWQAAAWNTFAQEVSDGEKLQTASYNVGPADMRVYICLCSTGGQNWASPLLLKLPRLVKPCQLTCACVCDACPGMLSLGNGHGVYGKIAAAAYLLRIACTAPVVPGAPTHPSSARP